LQPSIGGEQGVTGANADDDDGEGDGVSSTPVCEHADARWGGLTFVHTEEVTGSIPVSPTAEGEACS
jgi:hypothetical protein